MKIELKDTIEMMHSDDFKERFRAEYYQLKIRRTKLEKILYKYEHRELEFTPNSSYRILAEQLQFMKGHELALETRAVLEEVDLKTKNERSPR